MADKIEEKALALVNEVMVERGYPKDSVIDRRNCYSEALCRTIESHEADKQAFSDAVEEAVKGCGHDGLRASYINNMFGRFIIKKPDPLYEALKAVVEMGRYDTAEQTQLLKHELAARGLGVARIGEVVEANNAPL